MSIVKPKLPEGYGWGDVLTRIVSGPSNLLVNISIAYSYPIEGGYSITDEREFYVNAYSEHVTTKLNHELQMISEICWARHNIENLLKE